MKRTLDESFAQAIFNACLNCDLDEQQEGARLRRKARIILSVINAGLQVTFDGDEEYELIAQLISFKFISTSQEETGALLKRKCKCPPPEHVCLSEAGQTYLEK